MSDYIPVEGSPNLVRDPRSHAIINTDRSAYLAHKQRVEVAKKKQAEIQSMQEDINTLKEELSGIKGLLQEIAKRI